MRHLKFENKKITGILSVVPKNTVSFDDEVENYNFPIKKSLKLKSIMGYKQHCLVNDNTTSSDLAVHGLNYLFKNNLLAKDDIDALIVVTQTPDFLIPPTSNVIQGKCGLGKHVICMDINQGCAGYIMGLMQSFLLLGQPSIKKVALVNVDVLSRKTSKKDRNSFPLVGDAAAISIVENSDTPNTVYMNMIMDGSRSNALRIEAGGLFMPSTAETAEMKDVGDGNFRSKDNLTMNGTAIFNFVMTEVGDYLFDLFKYCNINKNSIDYFMFHQPNKFMLEKLADKIEVPRAKMPSNVVENYGNSSGVTIPLNICHNLGSSITKANYNVCMSGFGSGLTYAGAVMDIGNIDFCEIIKY